MNDTEKIWMNFENKLRSFILSKVQVKDDTEEILQELFVKIHSKINSLRDETKLQSWIYQIARNLIIDYFRKNKKEINNEHNEVVFEEFTDDNPEMSEAIDDMIKMMSDLPPEYCEALCLTELEGLSQKEYAEKIGISYSGAKSRVQRSRKMLRDMLMNCCHYEFDKYGTVLEISPKHCCCCCPG